MLAKGRNLWQRPDRQRRGAARRLGYQEGRREGRGESCPSLTCASGRRRAPWPCARARGYSVACPVGRSSGRACAWPVCVAGQGRCRVCAAFCPCARARPKTPQSAALLAPGAPLAALVLMPLPRTCTQGALESKVKKATGTRTQPRGNASSRPPIPSSAAPRAPAPTLCHLPVRQVARASAGSSARRDSNGFAADTSRTAT